VPLRCTAELQPAISNMNRMPLNVIRRFVVVVEKSFAKVIAGYWLPECILLRNQGGR